MVMGHGRCGGIAAVVQEGSPLSKGDFIGKWMADVKEVASTMKLPNACSELERYQLLERASVEHSLRNLRSFPWVARLEASGELTLSGTWFDVALGELHVFDEALSQWRKLD